MAEDRDDKKRHYHSDNRKFPSKESDGGKKKYEEFAIVLDYLPRGHADDKKPMYAREPIIQVIGNTFFTLLELVPKKNINVKIHEEIFIGKGPRSFIDHVKGRVSYDELTASAKFELPNIIHNIVEKDSKRFVQFFNESRPLTTRMHQLELLPGIGKKLMWSILEERKKQPFADFKNLSSRVRIPDPVSAIEKRVIIELEGSDKYRVFTRHPPQEHKESN
jgi:putative nucleotide binding protein